MHVFLELTYIIEQVKKGPEEIMNICACEFQGNNCLTALFLLCVLFFQRNVLIFFLLISLFLFLVLP